MSEIQIFTLLFQMKDNGKIGIPVNFRLMSESLGAPNI